MKERKKKERKREEKNRNKMKYRIVKERRDIKREKKE